MKRLLALIGNLVLLAGMTGTAIAMSYNFIDLGTLGGSYIQANSIKENVPVVCVSKTESENLYALLLKDDVMTDLETLGRVDNQTITINNEGGNVSESMRVSGSFYSSLWERGLMTYLGTLLLFGSGLICFVGFRKKFRK